MQFAAASAEPNRSADSMPRRAGIADEPPNMRWIRPADSQSPDPAASAKPRTGKARMRAQPAPRVLYRSPSAPSVCTSSGARGPAATPQLLTTSAARRHLSKTAPPEGLWGSKNTAAPPAFMRMAILSAPRSARSK